MQPISHYDVASKVYEIDPKTGSIQEYAKDAAHVAHLYTTTESLNTCLEKYKSVRNAINALHLLALSRLSAALHTYIKDKYPVQSYLWNFFTWLALRTLKNFSNEFQQAFIKQSQSERRQIATLREKYRTTPSDETLERIGALLCSFQSDDMDAIIFFFDTRTKLGKTTQLTDYTFTLIKTHNLITKDPVASWPIARRFRQLHGASCPTKLLDLAYHIESVVLTKPKVYKVHFKKSQYTIIKQNDATQLFILTKNKLNEGGYKTVHCGVAVPFDTDQPHFPVADGIHRDQAIGDEARLQAFFASQPPNLGICPVLYSDSERIITPLGGPMTHSLQTILDLAQGVTTIHEQEHIHGDLSEKNVIDFQGARLIDFGFCFNPKKTAPPFPLTEGFYGNVGYTPPEMLSGARKIDFFAAEMWAFGCLCFEIIYDKPVPWKEHVEQLYKSNRKATPIFFSFVRSQIQKLWNGCHRDDWLLHGVLHMLSFFPEDRYQSNRILHHFRSHSG